MRVLILRPEPGAGESAARARALGLTPIVAPLFTICPRSWTPPDPASFDAVLLTSANAPRHGGSGMTPFLALPCYAVGDRTAEEARNAGFADVRVGSSDGAALLALAERDGAASLLHLCGHDHRTFDRITSLPVYAAEPSGTLPPDLAQTLVLLHSPRAAARFAVLAGKPRNAIRIAAISPETAAAAGGGWQSVDIAAAPRDQALLELAAKLCQTAGA
jgi:uroporphyrinogen-III synthase